MDPESDYRTTTPSPAESLQADQETERLERALRKLPDERRELLILSRFQGLKYQQIGDLLGCPASAVKMRIFRALGELRQIYFDLDSGLAVARKDGMS
jgi:RNA polymerase sigma-70 factor (ECF subfamily)